MPFTNQPLRFHLPAAPGRKPGGLIIPPKTIAISTRFRPTYVECRDDDDDKKPVRVLRSAFRAYRDNTRVHLESVTSHGGTVELRKRYWAVVDTGPDELSGAPGDHPLDNVVIAFDGERFAKHLANKDEWDPQLRATYEALLGQHLIQLQLRLNDDKDPLDTTALFLKLEYTPTV